MQSFCLPLPSSCKQLHVAKHQGNNTHKFFSHSISFNSTLLELSVHQEPRATEWRYANNASAMRCDGGDAYHIQLWLNRKGCRHNQHRDRCSASGADVECNLHRILRRCRCRGSRGRSWPKIRPRIGQNIVDVAISGPWEAHQSDMSGAGIHRVCWWPFQGRGRAQRLWQGHSL